MVTDSVVAAIATTPGGPARRGGLHAGALVPSAVGPGRSACTISANDGFWLIIDRLVQRVESRLTRWKCFRCGEGFTLYPDFALPHKRYVRQVICGLADRYVSDDGVS